MQKFLSLSDLNPTFLEVHVGLVESLLTDLTLYWITVQSEIVLRRLSILGHVCTFHHFSHMCFTGLSDV